MSKGDGHENVSRASRAGNGWADPIPGMRLRCPVWLKDRSWGALRGLSITGGGCAVARRARLSLAAKVMAESAAALVFALMPGIK